MRRFRAGWPGLICGLALAAPTLRAAPPIDDVAVLAARIDKFVDERLAEEKVPAAQVADDAEFMHRVYLDLTGRIPRVANAHRFLRDKVPDKRRQLVDELLRSGNHVNHFTNVWRTTCSRRRMCSRCNSSPSSSNRGSAPNYARTRPTTRWCASY